MTVPRVVSAVELDMHDELLAALKDAWAILNDPEVGSAFLIAAIHGASGTPDGRDRNQARRDRIEAALAKAEARQGGAA